MNLGSAGGVKCTWNDLTWQATLRCVVNARTLKIPSMTFCVMMCFGRWFWLGLRMRAIAVL